MTTENLTLDKTDETLLRYLASKYPERALVEFLERDRIVNDNGLNDVDYDRWIAMFEHCQFLTLSPCQTGRYAELVHVQSAAVVAVNKLDHQPPPDYWKRFEKWFRSKWWSVPVLFVGAAIAVVGGFISVVKTIVALFDK